jgi:hypothetical protein
MVPSRLGFLLDVKIFDVCTQLKIKNLYRLDWFKLSIGV